MKRTILASGILLIILSNINAQKFSAALSGPYLGQKPPGLEAELFAPGIISGIGIQTRICATPDGTELIYSQCDTNDNRWYLVSIRQIEGVWQKPETILRSDEFSFCDPTLSSDGKRLFYSVSGLPDNRKNSLHVSDIGMIRRSAGGWSTPVNGLPVNTQDIEVYPFYSTDDKLYFTRIVTDGRSVMCSSWANGTFAVPVETDIKIGGKFISGMVLSPDNNIMLCHSFYLDGAECWDLFVSVRDKSGQWGSMINLGEKVNTVDSETNPTFSPDGKYIFFTRNDDIYWVSSEVIKRIAVFSN